MSRRIVAGAMVAVLLVAGCTAPSQRYLDTYRRDCTAGDRVACDMVPRAEYQVSAEKRQKAAEFGEGVLKVLAFTVLVLGAAAGGYAAGVESARSSRPAYVAPVYVAPRRQVSCTSMNLGGGMVTTDCY